MKFDTPEFAQYWKQDLVAGLSVAAVAIPQSIAYAQVAGLPAYMGLYTICIPAIIGGLTASSAYISTGTTAISALLIASVLADVDVSGTGIIVTASALALLVGCVQILIGVLRLGSLIRYIAHPVVMGYVNAAAIIIGVSQLEPLLGIRIAGNQTFVEQIYLAVAHISDAQLSALLFGLCSLAIILTLKFKWPLFPGTLFAMLLSIWVSVLIGTSADTVGVIDAHLPSVTIPLGGFHDMRRMVEGALLIGLIGYVEGYSVAKVVSGKTRTRMHPNKEVISLGMANITAGLTQAYPVAGSFSRTALNFSAGARTKLSAIVVGVVTIMVILFFTPIFTPLPKATLSAIVLAAVINIISYKELIQLARMYPREGIVGLTTFFATLAFAPHMNIGLLIGIGMSVLLYLHKAAHPYYRIAYLGNEIDLSNLGFVFTPYPTNRLVLAVAPEWSILFTNASAFEDRVLQEVKKYPEVKYVLLLCRGINSIDSTGNESLLFVCESLKESGVTLMVAGMKSHVMDTVRRSGLSEKIGEKNFFVYANDGLKWIHEREKE